VIYGMTTSKPDKDCSDIRNIDAKLENRTKRILRLEALLRDSGKGDIELKAELAKVKAENRSLKVDHSTTKLTSRASIMRSCPNQELEVFENEKIGTLHRLVPEVFLQIQVSQLLWLQLLPVQMQLQPAPVRHNRQVRLWKNVGCYDFKNWKHG
jgi:hypothetical protein